MSLKIIHALKRTTGTKRRILFSVPLANKISLASSARQVVKLSSLKWYLRPNVSKILSSYICLTISIVKWKARFSLRAFSELLTSHGNRIISTGFQYHYILDPRKISCCMSPTLFIAVLLSEFLPEKLRLSWISSQLAKYRRTWITRTQISRSPR